MNNPIITYEWNRKLFSSQIRLWELSCVGAIKVEVKERQYGADYQYYTTDGESIASYYKDYTFGHGSQATGIELKGAIPDVSYLHNDITIDHNRWSRTGSISKLAHIKAI